MRIDSELHQLRKELKDWKELYYRMEDHAVSLEMRLEQEICINENYSDFFNTHPDYCNWMRDHNAQFQAFKQSPFYVTPRNNREDNRVD